MDRVITVAVLVLALGFSSLGSAARTTHAASASKYTKSSSSPTGSASKHKHVVANSKHASLSSKYSASNLKKGHVIASSHVSNRKHHRRRSGHQHVIVHHYAYPMDMFLSQPPEFLSPSLPAELTREVKEDFENGVADAYPASALVQAGVVSYMPLHGGIFWRRQPVKYLIMHSTETGVPRSAPQVVNGWNSLGRRHAGAQYIVDRDGQIYETVDPDLATVHVNVFKTLPGINNDNSIGIEMVHAGRQQYTHDQLKSVVHLVAYLLQRYQIDPSNLITHRYAQQGDHTDPVAFDWNSFVSQVGKLQKHAIAKQMLAVTEAMKEIPDAKPSASGAAEAASSPNNQ